MSWPPHRIACIFAGTVRRSGFFPLWRNRECRELTWYGAKSLLLVTGKAGRVFAYEFATPQKSGQGVWLRQLEQCVQTLAVSSPVHFLCSCLHC